MAEANLTVWGRKTSSNVRALMWCIAELDLMPVTRIDVGHKYGGNDTPQFLAMNRNGTVPVLKDGAGEPSLARCRPLSARCGRRDFRAVSGAGLETAGHSRRLGVAARYRG